MPVNKVLHIDTESTEYTIRVSAVRDASDKRIISFIFRMYPDVVLSAVIQSGEYLVTQVKKKDSLSIVSQGYPKKVVLDPHVYILQCSGTHVH